MAVSDTSHPASTSGATSIARPISLVLCTAMLCGTAAFVAYQLRPQPLGPAITAPEPSPVPPRLMASAPGLSTEELDAVRRFMQQQRQGSLAAPAAPAYASPQAPTAGGYIQAAPVLRQPSAPSQAPQADMQPATAPTAAPGSVVARTRDPSMWIVPDPQVSAALLAVLRQLPAADDTPAPGQSQILAFVDPRCPHCFDAHAALSGRLAVRWIPIPGLGDTGIDHPALGDTNNGLRLARNITGAAQPTAALKRAMDAAAAAKQQNFRKDLPPLEMARSQPPADVAATPDTERLSKEAVSVFVEIVRTLQAAGAMQVGVPMFFVPQPSGQLGIWIGMPEDGQIVDKLRAMAQWRQ